MRVVDREAPRLLVMSPTHGVLLMRLEPTFRPPFWVTPGGGRDADVRSRGLSTLHRSLGRLSAASPRRLGATADHGVSRAANGSPPEKEDDMDSTDMTAGAKPPRRARRLAATGLVVSGLLTG